MTKYANWEPVIGLEIHVQLSTKSKLFSSAPNHFGAEPNENISDICTGQPGALPLLNKEAVKKAVQFGCAVNGNIALDSRFDRKSYFYPDSPRNFQITQFARPIVEGGTITADVEGKTKQFQINRAHIEDDAGMLKHFSTFAGCDYNRAGVPLLEIVSEPCMHGPKDASAYAMAIRSIMEYIGASNCNMEEGSLRIDVNISVRPKGSLELRNKVEVKNMNSFTFMEEAIEAEIRRQVRLYEENPDADPKTLVEQATFRYDPEKKKTIPMRKKEGAADYRYFPEPDLPPVLITKEYIEEVRSALPELPHQRYERYIQLGLTEYNASVLINNKRLSDFFEKALQHSSHAVQLCNWITVEFVGRLKDTGKHLLDTGIWPEHIATLVNLIDKGTITGKIAKTIADEMILFPGKDPAKIVDENPDYKPLSDTGEVEKIVASIVDANPQSIADYKAGKDKAFQFLVGQVMKQTKGKAPPALVKELIQKKIG